MNEERERENEEEYNLQSPRNITRHTKSFFRIHYHSLNFFSSYNVLCSIKETKSYFKKREEEEKKINQNNITEFG